MVATWGFLEARLPSPNVGQNLLLCLRTQEQKTKMRANQQNHLYGGLTVFFNAGTAYMWIKGTVKRAVKRAVGQLNGLL